MLVQAMHLSNNPSRPKFGSTFESVRARSLGVGCWGYGDFTMSACHVRCVPNCKCNPEAERISDWYSKNFHEMRKSLIKLQMCKIMMFGFPHTAPNKLLHDSVLG